MTAWHESVSSIKFHELLRQLDERAAALVHEAGCVRCGGRLYAAHYGRKVRGLSEEALEAGGYERRLSFCCGAEGCRRRATPPSVRFSLRRVYATMAVLALCLRGTSRTEAIDAAQVVERRAAPARSTRRRWLRWWREALLDNAWFVTMLGQLREPARFASSPDSLLRMFSGTVGEQTLLLSRWLSPLTTQSVRPETSRIAMAF